MARKNQKELVHDFPGGRIDLVLASTEFHVLATKGHIKFVRGTAATEIGLAAERSKYGYLCVEDMDPVVTACFPTEASLVFELRRELAQGEHLPHGSLPGDHLHDDPALAVTLSVVLGADLLAHQALVHGVDFDPTAVFLVDQLGRQRRAVAQFDLEAALGGDMTALRLFIDRIAPARKDPIVDFPLPKLEAAKDIVPAAAAVVRAVSVGDLSPKEAAPVMDLIEVFPRALEMNDSAERVARLENLANPD